MALKNVFILVALFAMFGFGNIGVAMEKTTIAAFESAPFPLKRNLKEHGIPFFDVIDNRRRGHNSPRGGIYWEDATYYDNRVLLSLSKDFNPNKHPVIIVYLHGNQTILDRDLIEAQHLPTQLSNSGINALLVAPQFALDALDSSAGRFMERDYFSKFITEVAERTSKWQRSKTLKSVLLQAPIIIMAYSGGYVPAGFILERGGVGDRVKGVILLDSLYSNEDKFADWMQLNRKNFLFFSAYTQSTRPLNERLQSELDNNCIKFERGLPETISLGQISFLDLGDNLDHNELPLKAWCEDPITDVLRRIKHNKFSIVSRSNSSRYKRVVCRKN